MTTRQDSVTWVVVSAAPPATRIHELLALLHADPQHVVLVATPAAVSWIDDSRVRGFTAGPIRSTQRAVNEPKTYPAPDLVVAAPLTFNTINKWAAGINDNAALGVLNEALGDQVPIVASPVAKASLAAHPAFARSVDILASAGVTLTATNAIIYASDSDAYDWSAVLHAIEEAKRHA